MFSFRLCIKMNVAVAVANHPSELPPRITGLLGFSSSSAFVFTSFYSSILADRTVYWHHIMSVCPSVTLCIEALRVGVDG